MLEHGLGIEIKRDYFNQVDGVLCKEAGFNGILYALPYQLGKHNMFNPTFWYKIDSPALIENAIKTMEELIVQHTSIEKIKIKEETFLEASAYCKVTIDGKEQNAWLTWENCD